MNLKHISRLATVSALALGFASYSGPVWAYQFDDPSAPLVVNVTAEVLNDVTVNVTAMDLPDIGATSDAVDIATMAMDATGAITDDPVGAGVGGAGEAHLVSGTNAGQPAVLDIVGGLASSFVYVYYSNMQDLVGPGVPHLEITEVGPDDMATPGSCTKIASAAGPGVCDTQVTGIDTTDGLGDLTINVGITLNTVATAAPYLDGSYAGTFDVVMTY